MWSERGRYREKRKKESKKEKEREMDREGRQTVSKVEGESLFEVNQRELPKV